MPRFPRVGSDYKKLNNTRRFDTEMPPLYPSGAVPLNSRYYIERSPVEEQVYQEIDKPGGFVRIKAPREMGKTSLLVRVLDYAKRQDYRTVSLNLEQVDQAILKDLNQFLRWLCANIARQFQLESKLDQYWDADLGSKISCTSYFEDYLLKSINRPFVLALDEVNQIFEHPQTAKDFLPLLRSWYEEAKTLPIWQKLRLIVVHSTEIYVPLQLNQSPFNVGLPIQLTQFSLDEVQQLAQLYELDWEDGKEAQKLMDMVDGHPALVHIAIYHLSHGEENLAQLLETAPTVMGIYNHHLQRHWVTLQEQPKLVSVLDRVMSASEPLQLDYIVAYKLSSLGLIKKVGDKAIPSCDLYRQYFKNNQKKPIVRRRGVILTAKGLEKLQKAKSEAEWQEKSGQSYTLEELREQTGLSMDTIMKILAAEIGVDKQSLKGCFQAFNLILELSDYEFPI